jgi:electron transport complex protein RnfG
MQSIAGSPYTCHRNETEVDMREIIRLIVVLSLICGVSASALQTVNAQLTPIIEKQIDLYIRGPALQALFGKPAESLLANKILVPVLDQVLPVFYDAEGVQPPRIAIEVTGTGGYDGDIVLMVGIDLQSNQLLGLEIIQHNETPGVGARIESESFRKQFKNLPLSTMPALKKNGGKVDGISGATYSSSAVINGTDSAIKIIQNNNTQIIDLIRTQMQKMNND